MNKLILMLGLCLGLTACQTQTNKSTSPNESIKDDASTVISAHIANTEYSSLNEFFSESNEEITILAPVSVYSQCASNSNAQTLLHIEDINVTIAESYISVMYECEIDGDVFNTKVATYTLEDGESALESIKTGNPNLFSELTINDIITYYCPGGAEDWFDCYAMVLDGKMVVINIQKEYATYISEIVDVLSY